MQLTFGASTDVGRVRDGNEDGFVVDEAIGLFAVADGMGGHRGGEVASATALETLRASMLAGDALREAVVAANHAVYEKSLADEALHGMGTTLTAGLMTTDDGFLLGHVGDSRAYLMHAGELTQITVDHSLVEELVRDGQLTEDEAAVHPQRSIITRALGVDAEVDVDLYPVELEPGDRVLLCSDGLTAMVPTNAIASALRLEADPERAARWLVDSANAAGGEDNITVVVIAATEDDADSPTTKPPPLDGDAHAAPIIDADPTAATTEPAHRRGPVARVALWALPVVVILALAIGAIGWYARRGYFVGVADGRVTVYRGVPGGLLGWDPTIERRTDLEVGDLPPAGRELARSEAHFGSRAGALALVARLRDRSATTTASTTTPTGTPPSTTAAAPTTSIVPAAAASR